MTSGRSQAGQAEMTPTLPLTFQYLSGSELWTCSSLIDCRVLFETSYEPEGNTHQMRRSVGVSGSRAQALGHGPLFSLQWAFAAIRTVVSRAEVGNFFCKGPDVTYFRLCRSPCHCSAEAAIEIKLYWHKQARIGPWATIC